MLSSKNSRRIRVLVSVRSHEEAALACNSGADFIDAKEPKAGALGKLSIVKIKEIITVLRETKFDGKVTATYGDNLEKKINFSSQNFSSYFFLGLDAVKIGFDGRGLPLAEKAFSELIEAYENIILHRKKNGSKCKLTKIIPVLMIDKGLNLEFLDFMMRAKIKKYLFGFMVDTKYKAKYDLFDITNIDHLNRFFKKIDSYNLPYGVAGSLNQSSSGKIKLIKPFWAGYRGGVCDGDRNSELSSSKIKLIVGSLKII